MFRTHLAPSTATLLHAPHCRLSMRGRFPRRPFPRALLIMVLVGVLVMTSRSIAHAATIEVTNLNDQGAGSLRQAIIAANANTSSDTITFAASLSGIIQLDEVLPEMSTNMKLQGPGADVLTVRRNTGGDYRIFRIGSNATVTVHGLTIANGKASTVSGAGIFNFGTLTVSNSIITGNIADGSGGGIYNADEGTLTVSNSIITGNTAHFNGGGIYNADEGRLMVIESTISGNQAKSEDGGGINNAGMSTVSNSTISGNTTHRGGGGIRNVGTLTVSTSTISGNTANIGGGVSSITKMQFPSTIIRSSTLSGNTADLHGGGLANGHGQTVIEHTTVTGNTAPEGEGSGVASEGDDYTWTVVGGSIIAGNTNSDVDLAYSKALNSFHSKGWNRVGNGTSADAFTGAGDLRNVLDPGLGPLAANGGSTLTHALLLNSPARDTGDPNFDPDVANPPLPYDQRGPGFARVRNGRIDIGAFELAPIVLPSTPVPTSAPTNTATSTPNIVLTPFVFPTHTPIPANTATGTPNIVPTLTALPATTDVPTTASSPTSTTPSLTTTPMMTSAAGMQNVVYLPIIRR